MTGDLLVASYNTGRKNFAKTKLYGIYLAKYTLREIDFTEANLTKANLFKTDLTNSVFRNADLAEAYLFKTRLVKANLTEVNLAGASVFMADLTEADLSQANLTKCCLTLSDLTGARFHGTCLDTCASIPETDLSRLEAEGEYVIGYRTKEREFAAHTTYEPGGHYIAPWFSICTKSKGHPGFYIASRSQAKRKSRQRPLIKVKALRSETVKVGNVYRTKQIWVLEDV